MKQYELRWAEMPEPVGQRPVIVLTRTAALSYLNKVVVAEVTTTIRGIRQEVSLGRAEGLVEESVANFDNVHVVAKARIGARIGAVPPKRVVEIKRALGYALDWAELKAL